MVILSDVDGLYDNSKEQKIIKKVEKIDDKVDSLVNDKKNSEEFVEECEKLLKGLSDNYSERAMLYKPASKAFRKQHFFDNSRFHSLLITSILKDTVSSKKYHSASTFANHWFHRAKKFGSVHFTLKIITPKVGN